MTKKKKDIPLYYFVQWDYDYFAMGTAKDIELEAEARSKTMSYLKTKKARQRYVDDVMHANVDGKEAYVKVKDLK